MTWAPGKVDTGCFFFFFAPVLQFPVSTQLFQNRGLFLTQVAVSFNYYNVLPQKSTYLGMVMYSYDNGMREEAGGLAESQPELYT